MSEGMLRNWIEPQPVEVPEDFQSAIGGRPMVAQILVQRGLIDLETARAFLDPEAYTPTSAFSLPGLLQAAERIERAILQSEKICVWGDFDVDGQTSTTLLVSALQALGAHVIYHIPVRARESHGVNWENLEPILSQGVGLLVTCDTGISSHEAVAAARQSGVDVVITDHHDLPESLPEAHVMVNPKLVIGQNPLAGLPGVGVAYKLIEALFERAGRAEEAHTYLDLVALGIVADLAVQSEDTRYLLQRGLAVLRKTQRTGLKTMIELAGLQPANMTEEHIGFMLGPRLNALGRLDDANPAVELLTTQDAGRARILATHLEGLNARRRLLTEQVLRGALAQIEKDPSLLEQAVLVLAHPDWPAGVIGIVASELTERFNRPTILLSSPPDQPARGSARSIDGVNITAAIAAQKHLLLGFGGHPMAAGLSMNSENLPAFRRGISRFVEKVLGGTAPRPTLSIDGYLSLTDLSLDLVSDLERLAPFGPGNPPLVLAIPRLSILSSSSIGRESDHLQIIVKDEFDRTHKVIWWRGAGWPLPEGVFDLACVVRASNYRGQREVQVEWIDARPVETSEINLRKPIDVIDQRDLEHPLPILQDLVKETQSVVWAEGEALDRLTALEIPTCDRTQLSTAETLIIWSTPPGRSELEAALAAVNPRSVVIFAVEQSDHLLEGFLRRTAGLVKYTLEKLEGRAELSRMAAAAGQRTTAMLLGLKWMEQRGFVQIERLAVDQVQLAAGTRTALPNAEETLAQLRTLLSETSAYRSYFRTADKGNLL
jgi:single-stranded-DNA-specific exonuclease